VAGLDRQAVFRAHHGEVSVLAYELGHHTAVVGRKVLNHHKRQRRAYVGSAEHARESLETSRRGPNANDGNRFFL
jgi:hypothetical protein